MAQISIFGLGYVGLVTAACLAHEGHQVIGVDVAQIKVDLINQGVSPILEDGVDNLVRESVQLGQLVATTDARQAIEASDIAFICVGTPSLANGNLDTRYIKAVTTEIGAIIRERSKPFLLVFRSTVIPGTIRSSIIPTLEEHSGRKIGDGYEIVFHPEFLREGTSVYDFYNPPKIVFGERRPGSSEPALALYAEIQAPRFVTSLEVAEMVKYTDNLFHALKITFTNEMGQFCQVRGIDSREVMDIFCADTKLNISTKYLRPGFAFGGSCLPKDLRAFLYAARSSDLSLPMLENILPSNKSQIERILQLVLAYEATNAGLVGLAFKPGTEDLRESPLVELAEQLIGKGITVRIYDKNVNLSRLIGQNKAFVEQRLPHISRVLIDSLDNLCDCQVIVMGHPIDSSHVLNWLEKGKIVIDLVGVEKNISHSNYVGIAW